MIENVILVDSRDRPVGTAEKVAAHKGVGKLHRAFTIFLRNHQDLWLTTKRSAEKPLWPMWWDAACSSHQRPDENDIEASRRRLKFELGIKARELEYAFKYEYHAVYSPQWAENEINHIVIGEFDGRPNINPREVVEFKWRTSQEINEIVADPEQKVFAPWFSLAWNEISRKL